jgi:tetratricopeptide (TPR) repeat protein
MSASLFADTGELFRRKADLVGHFVEFLCDKVLDGDGERQAILDSVFRSIAMGVETRTLLLANHRAIIERLIGAGSPFVQERELDRLLLRTGLVRRTGEKYRFAHELLRYHFAATVLSERHKPTADIVATLDPFRVGWDTISLLGQLWGQRGLAVNPMVRSLLEFGDGGLRCAAEIIAAVPSVSDSPAHRIVERLLREAKERGPTVLAQDLLTILAEAREAIRVRLSEELYSDDYLDGVFIAECLLDAGVTDEALDHLLWLAKDTQGYPPDRVRAAELLLKHGHRDEAITALRAVSSDGDELWTMVDAAILLYRLERNQENRERLEELLGNESGEPGDFIHMSAFADLVSLGEIELALPRLRAAATITAEDSGRRDRGDAIEAAIAIGKGHDQREGHALLRNLLRPDACLREDADVIDAMNKLGFEVEARIAARDRLARNPLAIDWQSLRLLGSLGLNEAAQEALEQALEHRLSDGGSTAHDVTSLLDHMPSAIDPTPLAGILRRHLTDRSEPRLIGCLATLGAVQEAKAFLVGLLGKTDLRQQIEVAGELCKLGEQRMGLPRLRGIARRAETPPEIRAMAAAKLEQVGLLRQAAFSFARLARDETLDVKRRAQAAISFDELLHSRNVLVWRCLMAILEDQARAVVDRVEAGNALLVIDGDDGYDDIVYPEIEAILDEDGLSDKDALVVGAALGERGWRLRHMPRVRSALMSARVGLAARIDAMRSINLHDRNPEVDPVLAAIAADPGTPAKYAIEAAQVLSRRRRTDKTLANLAADESIPPAWRLEAITCRRPNLPSNELLRLAGDESIAIERRIEAIDQLPKIPSSKRGGALSKLATTPDLTFWEWLSIAEAAHRLGKATLRKRALRVAGSDSFLSMGERVALAQAHRADGNEAAVRKLALETLKLPFPVWANCDDGASVLEALEIGAVFDREASIRIAKNLIQADQTGWWDAPRLIAFLAEQTSEAEALALIEPLSHELRRSLDEAGAEDEGWLYIAANFLAEGWFDDYEAVVAFGTNQARTLAGRVHAYGLVLRYASAQSPSHEAARAALEELRDNPSWSKDDRLSAAKRLRLIDLPVEAEAWLDRVTSSNGDDDHPRARARLLADLGRHDEARSVLKAADPSALFQGFIFDRDEELLRSALGDDVIDSEMRAMALATDDPYDQIWRMKELVEKTGDRELLKVMRHRASDPTVHPDERLEAIDLLEQLGFRSLSREALATLDIREVDPARLAGQLIRSGRKADARALLANAETSLSEDDTYRLAVMSDLGLAVEIGLVRKAEVEVA